MVTSSSSNCTSFPSLYFGMALPTNHWNRRSAETEKCRYPTAMEYYEYIKNRISIEFYQKMDPDKKVFDLTLSKKMKYLQLISAVAEHLQCKPEFVQLTPSGYFDFFSRNFFVLNVFINFYFNRKMKDQEIDLEENLSIH